MNGAVVMDSTDNRFRRAGRYRRHTRSGAIPMCVAPANAARGGLAFHGLDITVEGQGRVANGDRS
jgi:hypothetical protein